MLLFHLKKCFSDIYAPLLYAKNFAIRSVKKKRNLSVFQWFSIGDFYWKKNFFVGDFLLETCFIGGFRLKKNFYWRHFLLATSRDKFSSIKKIDCRLFFMIFFFFGFLLKKVFIGDFHWKNLGWRLLWDNFFLHFFQKISIEDLY